MTHKTKGIVLRTVKYGESSIITTVYTELFGLQNYIVKGVRQSTKKSQGKANYFQPAAMLEMEVYHNEIKNLQFIKEFQWACLYEHIFFEVVPYAVGMYIIELLQHCIKQPETNPPLFYFVENTLLHLDKGSEALVANLPLYFTLHLASELGFQVQGEYSEQTPVLDLREGKFVQDTILHTSHISGELAQATSRINGVNYVNDLGNIQLNKNGRRQLLEAYRQYIAFHISDFGDMKTLAVLKEVLS